MSRRSAAILLPSLLYPVTFVLSFSHSYIPSAVRCAASTSKRVAAIAMSSDAAASGPTCVPGGKCVPCESLDRSHLLSKEQIEEELKKNLPLWEMKVDPGAAADGAICRRYTARNFQAALDSINAMGAIAERENHHPDFHLTGYRNVEVVLFTHSLGGISLNDVELAKMLDAEVAVEYSPKWLKSHPEAKKED